MKSFHPSRLDKMSTWRYYPIRKDFLRSLSLKLARLAYGKMGRALPAGIRENGSAVAQAAGQLSSAVVSRQYTRGTVKFDTKAIAERIKEVAVRENELLVPVARDVAFHMTDWLDDLARYSQFCANSDKMTNEQVNELLLAFLIHVPNHLAAASKLYTEIPVTDVFGVGATCEENG